MLLNSSAAIAEISLPVWTIPTQLVADGGYASLEWVVPDGVEPQFFKITETYHGAEFEHYTEASSLLARRVEPGEYGFVLQACVRGAGGTLECGRRSEELTLVVNRPDMPVLTESSAAMSAVVSEDAVARSGPEQLQPGHWYNPEKSGHGWSFYWSNRLALSPDDPLFGNNYDLVGIWYTYEAKAVAVDPGCADCQPVPTEYRPVVLKLKAVAVNENSYGGSLYATRPDGGEVWVGSAAVTFGNDNTSATIYWNASFKTEGLSDTDPLVFLHGSDPAGTDNISHFSGLWKARGNDDYYVATNVGESAEVTTVVFHDEVNDPVWIQSVTSGAPGMGSTDLCFAYVQNGYSPREVRPHGWSKDWFYSGCDASAPAGWSNRNGRRTFTIGHKQPLWVDFSLPGSQFASGSVLIGLSHYLMYILDKVASFHDVRYASNMGEVCEVGRANPACEVQLTWFTDGHYPEATVYAYNSSTGGRQKVVTSTQPAMIDIPFRTALSGLYDFELRMGDDPKSTLMARSGSFSVIGDSSNPEVPPDPADMPTVTASVSSSGVGVTVGEFRVDEAGSAIYSIPILNAPASGGLAPQISLEYSSRRGNGDAGVGWALNGISTISRCPQTMEQDGIDSPKGIGLDQHDRFCLDGQRLVADPASGTYGSDGTQYRTEIDDLTRITSYGSAGTGPEWFRAERKDGSIIEFGNTSDSRVEARGSKNPATVFAWAQNRLEDRSGNFILYQYLENDTGPVAFSLQTIEYAGNVRAGTLPSARLSFVYNDRTDEQDLSFNYLAGVKLEQRRLLRSIRLQGQRTSRRPLEDLRFYELEYDQDGHGRQVLVEIRECRSAGKEVCFKPTRFEWLKSESMIEAVAKPMDGLLPRRTLGGLALADVSGDGRPDLLYTKTKGLNHFLHVQEATGTASFREWALNFSLPRKSDKTPPRVFVLDVNSDGYQDVVYVAYSKATDDYTWVTRLSTGTGFSEETQLNPAHRFVLDDEDPESRFRIMDFNGDGLSDVLHTYTYRSGNAWTVSVLLNETGTGTAPRLSDPIEVDVDNAGLFPFDTTGDWEQSVLPPFFGWGPAASSMTDIPDARVFDFNGDGAVDLLLNVWRDYKRCITNCVPNTEAGRGETKSSKPVYEVKTASFWVLMESHGVDGFNRHSVVALGEGCDFLAICDTPEYAGLPRSGHVWPVDINADGLADLAWGDKTGTWFYQINTGNSFTPATPIGDVGEDANKLVRFEDWNGDGYPDLVYPSAVLDDNARWMVYQNYFGRAFAATIDSRVPAGNVGGEEEFDRVENDTSVFADFDGDAKTDLLLIDKNKKGEIDSVSLYRGINVMGSREIEVENVITKLTNGFGASTEVSYRPLTDTAVYTRVNDSASVDWGGGAAVYDYTAPLYVVTSVSASSPTYHDPSARHQMKYHYVGAKLQAGGRGFLGFAEIIGFDPQSRIRTNTRYRQDFPFVGLPVDVTKSIPATGAELIPISDAATDRPVPWPMVRSDSQPPASLQGVVVNYSANQWREVQTVAGAYWIGAETTLTRNHTLAGNLAAKEIIHRSYGGYGNLTDEVSQTFANDSDDPIAKRTTENQWGGLSLPSWKLGKLAHTTVTHERAGRPVFTRESEYEYHPETGLVTRKVTDPGNTTLEIVTAFGYDTFGNRNMTSIQGSAMTARTSSVTHDTLGRFVVSNTDALGQVTYKVRAGQWDAFGNPLETENIDGIKTTYAVDLMGRAFFTYTEDGSWQKELRYAGGDPGCPDTTAWHDVRTMGDGHIGKQCFDSTGRRIRNVSNSLNGRLIYVDQYYDVAGRLSRISEPRFKSETVYWNETAYDALGRITGSLNAGGDDITTNFDEQAVGPCTPAGPGVRVIINALGQQTTEVRNVHGEIVESYDANCGVVLFDYDSVGNLTGVTRDDGSTTRLEYDAAGRKVSLSDPDKGSWRYAYNALGELTRQLDSKRQAIDFEYDSLGRISHRRELRDVNGLGDMATTVVNHEATLYQLASPGKSKVASVVYREGEDGDTVHRKVIAYDWLGRESETSTTITDKQFRRQTTYDAHGRVFQQFDASGDDHGLRYVYRNGQLSQLKEARAGVDGVVYQDNLDVDARGNVTTLVLGNGVSVFADYEPASGRLRTVRAFDALGVELQDVAYLFDVLGNLKQRHDQSGAGDFRENFGYDSFNRLKQVHLTAPGLGIQTPLETLAVDYGGTGNIRWKSDVGSYGYGSGNAGPHAVTSAGGASFRYDANGNQISGGGREITYTVFDKAESLATGDMTTTFAYGIGNARVQRHDLVRGLTARSTLYLDDTEYVTEPDGKVLFRRYLGGVAIATYYPSTRVQRTAYLLKDHLGSIHTVLDEDGLISTRMYFDAFGARREMDYQSPADRYLYVPLNDITTRGFTGHEHVDDQGVIHMNGRIYDARLGRFLQADPFVQAPKNTQGLNRYSYAFNNPLSYVDPSGYFSFSRFIKKWGRVIVAAVASYFTFGAAYSWAVTSLANVAAAGNFVHGLTAVNTMAAVFGGASAGFVGGAIISGTLKGAVRGAFAGAITGGIAKYYGDTYNLGRVASESVGGGVSARILGGEFEEGLKFSLMVSGLTYLNYRMDLAERRNSAKNPDNLNKPGSGLFGRKYSIAGARRTVDPEMGGYLPCRSPAGGCQGLPISSGDQISNLFGMPYRPDGSAGYLVDTFAGPHDWFRNNVSKSYDKFGNSKHFTGLRGYVDRFANAALIPIAAPFSMATVIGTTPAIYITAMEFTYEN